MWQKVCRETGRLSVTTTSVWQNRSGKLASGWCRLIWVTLSESFRTSIRGFSGSNHEDIFWNFPNWSTSNLRNWVSIYRQLQADCLYHVNCLYNFPAYTWRQKRNAFPGLCSGSIFMIQKNLIIILGTEPRILCSEVIRKNNSSMTQLNVYGVFASVHVYCMHNKVCHVSWMT